MYVKHIHVYRIAKFVRAAFLTSRSVKNALSAISLSVEYRGDTNSPGGSNFRRG